MRALVAALGLLACAVCAHGCELVADFDRSKIPGPDASFDAGSPFPGPDDDAGSADAGGDAATGTDDAGADDADAG